eukprot:scaffold7380_cov115-Isochrysis_galbana.AAC.3
MSRFRSNSSCIAYRVSTVWDALLTTARSTRAPGSNTAGPPPVPSVPSPPVPPPPASSAAGAGPLVGSPVRIWPPISRFSRPSTAAAGPPASSGRCPHPECAGAARLRDSRQAAGCDSGGISAAGGGSGGGSGGKVRKSWRSAGGWYRHCTLRSTRRRRPSEESAERWGRERVCGQGATRGVG